MNVIKKLLFFLFFCGHINANHMHCLLVSTPDPADQTTREVLQKSCYDTIVGYGLLNTWVLETTNNINSHFENYTTNVAYPIVYDGSRTNDSVNELLALVAYKDLYNYNDDDLILKMTAKYRFLNESFVTTMHYHSKSDAIILKTNNSTTAFSGCFAMKWSIFLDLLDDWYTTEGEASEKSFDTYLMEYLDQNAINYVEIGNLYLE